MDGGMKGGRRREREAPPPPRPETIYFSRCGLPMHVGHALAQSVLIFISLLFTLSRGVGLRSSSVRHAAYAKLSTDTYLIAE
ncbi:hypothetical protein LZ31DRAFT_190345 [Colletotrichum somersetense]|nr:hypothetical protein LZ31DRAFT_190345 [Colletotrichum somersetense]